MPTPDELGTFLATYEKYLKGEIAYDDLPTLGGTSVPKPYETTCMAYYCSNKYINKAIPHQMPEKGEPRWVSWGIPIMCPECHEIAMSVDKRGRQPLPAARLLKK